MLVCSIQNLQFLACQKVLRKNKWLRVLWRDLAPRERALLHISLAIKLNAAESVRSRAHFASFRNCSLHEKGRERALLLLPRANADSYLTGHAPALTPFTVMVPIQSRRASAVLATLPPPSLVCRRIQSTH